VNINSIKLVYFSPNRTTKKVVEGIAGAIRVNVVDHLDLTPPEARTRGFEELQDELVIIGTPVYSCRVPDDAIHRLRRLKANNTPAVIILVYGNVDYKDALLELNDTAVEIGCKPVAAGVFIGEHSLMPIAHGRPDEEDLKKAREFGKKIEEKLKDTESIGDISPLQIPGSFPYFTMPQTPKDALQVYPETKETICTKCGTCADVCPTAAITINDTVITDLDACILCCACVHNCPNQARVMDSPQYQKIVEFTGKKSPERKEPEMYL
jgi:ferredoxin